MAALGVGSQKGREPVGPPPPRPPQFLSPWENLLTLTAKEGQSLRLREVPLLIISFLTQNGEGFFSRAHSITFSGSGEKGEVLRHENQEDPKDL